MIRILTAWLIISIGVDNSLGSVSKLLSCCKFIDGTSSHADLLNCTNRNLALFAAVNNDPMIGPQLSITIITRMTPNIHNFGSYSFFVQAVYAITNHYTMLPLVGETEDDLVVDYEHHRKLAPLINTMQYKGRHSDYVVWVDAGERSTCCCILQPNLHPFQSDLIVLDMTMRIEQHCSSNPQAHVIMSSDASSMVNTGFIIVRNSRWAKTFLHDWIKQIGMTIMEQ